MQEWLETNKEWMFSGVGVTVFVTLVGTLSSVITFWVKSRSDKKKRKRLSIKKELKEYKIEAAGDDDALTVSYQGRPYEHLCQFSVIVKNEGRPSIESLQLLFHFPLNLQVVHVYDKFSNLTISKKMNELSDSEKTEHLVTISRLETGDEASFTYVLDTNNPKEVLCDPRGVEDVDYIYMDKGANVDFSLLILYIAVFVALGAVPIFGYLFKALIIILAAPRIMDLFDNISSRKTRETSLVLKDVNVDGDGHIEVIQN